MALEERLRLIVDATTNSAEASFGKLTTSAERTATAADTAAGSVAAAADRVAQARAREADAAGKLAVEEDKLARARARYGDDSTQVVAAEERVAAAQRRVQLAARDSGRALELQETAQRGATDAARDSVEPAERASRSTGKLGEQLGDIKGRVLGLVAGVSLADWISESFTGFLEGARGANALATAMNASIEQAGQLGQLMASVGLEADDLLEIQAEFAQKSVDGLTLLGNELQGNADGTINWANSIVDTLEQLQRIPDATERNRLGFAMFGEEGYKQLSRLLNSGMSVADALEKIGTPFSAEDVRATQEYDAAMMDLRLTGGELSRTLGRELVPMLVDVLGSTAQFIDLITSIPAPIGLATAAAVLLGRVGLDPLAAAGGRVAAVTDAAAAALARYRVAAAIAGEASAIGAAGMSALAAAGTAANRAVGFLGGPLGVALLAAAGLWMVAQHRQESFTEAVDKGAQQLAKAEAEYGDAAVSSKELGERLVDERSAWDDLTAARRGAQLNNAEDGFWGGVRQGIPMVNDAMATWNTLFGDGEDAARGYADGIDKAKAELGAYGAQQEVAQATTESLTQMIAEGDTSSQMFADAVRDAANAQRDQTATSDIAAAALAAYEASTRGAYDATNTLLGAQLSAQDADDQFLQSLDDLKAARDDDKTSVDEIAAAHNDLKQAALDSGSAAGDAAVAAAKAAGQAVTPLDEINIRADAMLGNLREKLNTPGLTEGAQGDLQALIDQLQTARDKGDVSAVVTLTGAPEATAELDSTTADRDTTVTVESRNGPAVISYLDEIANAERLALIRVESRNGPAVAEYLGGLAVERLAIIRVETRGGPAVERYLDELTADRTVTITANGSGAAGAPSVGGGLRGAPGATALASAATAALRTVDLDQRRTGTLDRSQLSKAEQGRVSVEGIRAYTQRNGAGWLREIL